MKRSRVHTALAPFTLALGLGLSAPALGQSLEPRAYSPAPVGLNFIVVSYSELAGGRRLRPVSPVLGRRGADQLHFAGDLADLRALRPAGERDADPSLRLGGCLRKRRRDPRVHHPLRPRRPRWPLRRESSRRARADAQGVLRAAADGGTRNEPRRDGADRPVQPGEADQPRVEPLGLQARGRRPRSGRTVGLRGVRRRLVLHAERRRSIPARRGGRRTRSWTFQAHVAYTFLPGLWLAVDGTFYTGGRSTIDGVQRDDRQSNTRLGLTASVPLSRAMAVKASAAKGAAVRVGQDFTTLAVALQYRFSGWP